jgi:hypothetical protein
MEKVPDPTWALMLCSEGELRKLVAKRFTPADFLVDINLVCIQTIRAWTRD